MSLLVIFGAGASYDSIHPSTFPNHDLFTRLPGAPYYRPPLSTELFDDRSNFNDALTRFPQCLGRVAGLRIHAGQRGGFNVEQELELIKDSAERYPPARIELAALQFYIRDITTACGERWQRETRGLTNYAHLLSRIDRWRHVHKEKVVMVSFNYDTLLEMAAHSSPLQLELSDIDAYIARDDYKVIKPHGSANWGQVLNEPAPPSDAETFMIENVASLHGTNHFRVTADSKYGGKLVFPAIAIPVEGKGDFACPPAHMAALKSSMGEVTRILAIGWRASDHRFLASLGEGSLAGKRVHIVAASEKEALQTKANLVNAGAERSDLVTCSNAAGFSVFLSNNELEGFLQP